MAASKPAARFIQQLARQPTRHLHMTPRATVSSLLTSDHPAAGAFPRETRASTPKDTAATAESGAPVRQFNTSRSLKAVNDTSTIDFCYIPDFDPDAKTAPVMRVPILPETMRKTEAAQIVAEAEEILPKIYTVAADGTHIHAPSAMADVHDNGNVDFQGMAASVAQKIKKPIEEGVGMTRTLWNGLVDDILGPKAPRA